MFSQNKTEQVYIVIQPKFYSSTLELHEDYYSTQNDTIRFETMKFYLSDIQINYTNESFYKELNSYHLIDLENLETKSFPISIQKKLEIKSITFQIGIDSLASVSGAMEGDLDATKGMYWAWQSGFINMKIEGTSSSCKTRKNKFQFHIGGYLEPYYAMRTIEIPIEKSKNPKNELYIIMDLGKLFSEISLKETNTIMIPGKEAMNIADLVSKLFSIE
jgi:hypothetical protein